MATQVNKKQIPIKSIMMGAGSFAGSFLASRYLSNMVATKYEGDENKDYYALGVSAALAGVGVYSMRKIKNPILGLGIVGGLVLNASIKILALPSIKSNLPEQVQELLSGFSDINDQVFGSNNSAEVSELAQQEARNIIEAAKQQGLLGYSDDDVNQIVEQALQQQKQSNLLGYDPDMYGEEIVEGDDQEYDPDMSGDEIVEGEYDRGMSGDEIVEGDDQEYDPDMYGDSP